MDRYDEAVEYLCANPSEIYSAWSDGGICNSHKSHVAACLFQYATTDDVALSLSLNCGCLTMIRNSIERKAQTPELTARIRADQRIPLYWGEIDKTNPRHQLQVFAGWQREIDRVLGRNGVPKETEATEFIDIPEPKQCARVMKYLDKKAQQPHIDKETNEVIHCPRAKASNYATCRKCLEGCWHAGSSPERMRVVMDELADRQRGVAQANTSGT